MNLPFVLKEWKTKFRYFKKSVDSQLTKSGWKIISVSLLFCCFFNWGRNREEGKRRIGRRDRHTLIEEDSNTETEKDRERHTSIHACTHTYRLMDRWQKTIFPCSSSMPLLLNAHWESFCPSENMNCSIWRFYSTLLISLQVYLDTLSDSTHHFS